MDCKQKPSCGQSWFGPGNDKKTADPDVNQRAAYAVEILVFLPGLVISGIPCHQVSRQTEFECPACALLFFKVFE